MADTARQSLRERNRQLAREVVLDAAERLLERGETADFSMRALAAEAGVGFATPFNHFGSKNAIMQGLSARLVQRVGAQFREEQSAGDAIDRVLAMGRIGIALLLEKPDVYKAMVGSLSVATAEPAPVRRNSRGLWTLALGDFAGVAADMTTLAQAVLADQLAFHFRGCVSFWIAGELRGEELDTAFRVGAATLLLGFADPARRAYLIEQLTRL